MITALDQTTSDSGVTSQQNTAYLGDPTQFAAQLAQILAANAQQASGAQQQPAGQAVAQTVDPNTVLATQIQTNLMTQAASQPQPSTEDAQTAQQNAVLQSLNVQASMAFSQRNVPAFMAIQTMIAQHMAAMNPAQPTQTETATTAASTTATAKKTSNVVALTKTASAATTVKTTASNASTSSSSTVQTASNASTTNSSTTQTASNASTTNSTSAQAASNAGTGGTSTTQTASNAGTGGIGLEALNFMAGALANELDGLSGDDLAAALDDVAALAQSWFAKSPPGVWDGKSGTAGEFLIDTLRSELAGLSGPDRAQALDQLANLADKWSKPPPASPVKSAA